MSSQPVTRPTAPIEGLSWTNSRGPVTRSLTYVCQLTNHRFPRFCSNDAIYTISGACFLDVHDCDFETAATVLAFEHRWVLPQGTL